MDGLLSSGPVNDRETSHIEIDDDRESAPQLSTHTSIVNHADHCQNGTPRLTCANIDEDDSHGSVRITGTDKNPSNSPSQDTHARLRAMSESERALFSSRTGVRIFQKEPSHFYSQLTPPLSSSLSSLDTHNPYSTSAHIIPLEAPLGSILDSHQSNFGFGCQPKLPMATPRSSLGLNYHNPEVASRRIPAENIPRSLSFTYGGNSTQQTYVDASSYDSIPDSPATRWLQAFAENTAPVPLPDDEGQEIGSYIIGRQIGVGGFSVVKEAFTFQNGRQVQHAVKIVRKHATKDELGNEVLQSHFEHEVAVWRCLSNRYILPLLSVIDTSYATWTFTLLFAGGTLFDAFKCHRQGLPPALVLKYSYQLASALRYLHEDARVVHRDVKLENCVLDCSPTDGGNLRLCDFGLADFLPGDDTPSPREQFITPHSKVEEKHHLRPEDMVAGGSLAYAAPEQIDSSVPLLDTAIDMWSYGVVVHALVIGELPFHDPFAPKLQMMITKGNWNRERFAARVDGEIYEVVTSCLEMDRDRRWTARDVLDSQWISLHVEEPVDGGQY